LEHLRFANGRSAGERAKFLTQRVRERGTCPESADARVRAIDGDTKGGKRGLKNLWGEEGVVKGECDKKLVKQKNQRKNLRQTKREEKSGSTKTHVEVCVWIHWLRRKVITKNARSVGSKKRGQRSSERPQGGLLSENGTEAGFEKDEVKIEVN